MQAQFTIKKICSVKFWIKKIWIKKKFSVKRKFLIQTTFCYKKLLAEVEKGVEHGGIAPGKKMDGTIFGRRIVAKSTALVAIFIKKANYHIYAAKTMKNRFFFLSYEF